VQEQHARAWACVKEYMSNNLRIFPGKASEAVSTIMPEVNTWLDESLADLCVRDPDHHGIIIWINLPACGILTVQKTEWVLGYVSNTLQKFRRNGMAIIIHANRASQLNTGTGA